jgi:putative ABC transport system permease protein
VLIGAGLLARSFVRLLATDVGFEAERLLTFNVQLVKLGSAEERARAALALIDRLRALPGAESAGAATGLAPVIAQRGTRFEAEGDRSTDVRSSYWIAATPTYFEAIGAPIRAGRAFDDRDTSTAPKVVIINRALAERLFGSEPAVGRRVRIVNPEQSAEWRTIVGISPDVKYGGLDGTGDATIYTPFQQTPFLWAYVVVRTRAPDPLTLGRAVRSAVAEVDPRLTAASYQSAGTLIAESVGRQRFVMLFASSFALIALVLAAVGIYGVVSYGVAQRTSEISLRMALGARAGLIVRMFLREAAVLALAGVGAGLVGAYAATRAMSTLLFEVTPTDPATFALVSTGLVLVALAACLVPAWRATRCSPVEALSKGTG